jgi:hypothetical protein
MEERRTIPRVSIDIGELAVLPVPMSVRVLDISVSGVLLQAAHPVEPGARGSLRLNLDGVPFSAEVEVQRVSTGPEATDSEPYRIGAKFVATGRAHQLVIERFINQ